MDNNNKRILLVVDVSNLYYTVSKRFGGGRLDYKKLWACAESLAHGTIFRAIAYGADLEDEARAFKNLLRQFGYEVKYKVPSQYFNALTQNVERKADWDVGIAMDVVSILDTVDTVVFGTGDGDMEPCVKYIQSRGKTAFVIGAGVSRILKECVNDFMEISQEEIGT